MLNWVLSWFKLLLLHLEPFWLQSQQLQQQSPSQALKNPVDFDFYHLPHVTHWLPSVHTCFSGRNWFIKHQWRQRLGDGVRSKKVLLPSWLLSVWLTRLPSWTPFASTCDGCVHSARCVASLMASAWISALTATVNFIWCKEWVAVTDEERERRRRGRGRERQRQTKTCDDENNLEVDNEWKMRKCRNKRKKQSDPRCESDTEPQCKWNGEITYLLSGSPAWIGEEVECCCHGIAGCMLLCLVCNHHWCSHSSSLPLPRALLLPLFSFPRLFRLSDLDRSSADTSLRQQILLLTS